jgi:hypothetical protein
VSKSAQYASVLKGLFGCADIGGGQLLIEEGRWYTVNQLEVCQLHPCSDGGTIWEAGKF